MQDTLLSQICENEDILGLEQLVEEGFPLYLHINDIFQVVMFKELTKLFHYIVNYIKTHPFNKLQRGAFYRKFYPSIRSYELFLLLKYDPDENQVFNFVSHLMETSYLNETSFASLITESVLICKIIALNLPSNIIDIFRNYYIASVIELESESMGFVDYDGKWVASIKSKSDTDTLLNMRHSLDETFWKSWNELNKAHQEDILTIFHDKPTNDVWSRRSSIICGLIRAGLKDMYFELADRFKMTPNLLEYVESCRLGDFDFSLKILTRICGFPVADSVDLKQPHKIDIDMKEFKSHIKLNKLEQIAIGDYLHALDNSFMSQNAQLVELNEFIVNECLEITSKVNTKSHKYKSRFSAESFLRKSGRSESEVSEYFETRCRCVYETYGLKWEYRFENVKRVLEFMHEKGYKTEPIINFGTIELMVVYHLMCSGYKDMLRCANFRYNDNIFEAGELKDSKDDPRYTDMVKYFDSQNDLLRQALYATNVVNVDPMGVVFLYAKF